MVVSRVFRTFVLQPNNPVVGKPNALRAVRAPGAFGAYAIPSMFSVSLAIFKYRLVPHLVADMCRSRAATSIYFEKFLLGKIEALYE